VEWGDEKFIESLGQATMLELSMLDHPNQKADFFPPQIVAAFLNALAKRTE
jgi:hypothetical protein